MQKPAKKYYTPAEYLEMEEQAGYKSEYYRGEIFDMSGASINHNRIVGNIHSMLNRDLHKHNCEPFMSDLKIWIDSKELFTYPDVVVICDKPEFYPGRDDTVTNPVVIFEVLSESTKNYDRGEKFEFYRAVSTLREYILVDQYKVHIEHFYIGDDSKWVLNEHNDETNILSLSHLDFNMPVKQVYRRVDFSDSAEASSAVPEQSS